MLPVARDPGGRLPGGLLAFLEKRARRILPPYYAALALCLLPIALIPASGHPAHALGLHGAPPANGAGAGIIVSHLLLAHNLSVRWIFQIAPPFWSVATECQIYLLFPALLAVWRGYGITAAIAAGFALGYAVAALALPLDNPALRQLCPWYAGLFALGMAGAVAIDRRCPTRVVERTPRALAGFGIGIVALFVAGLALAVNNDRAFMVGDPLVGAATACLIVGGARRTTPGVATPLGPVFRLLEHRRAAALGSISYSLYLVHYPLLVLADEALIAHGGSPEVRLAALLLVASPLCIPAAILFHRLFERPSSSQRRRAGPVPTTGTASLWEGSGRMSRDQARRSHCISVPSDRVAPGRAGPTEG
jgi:peptidoglycan/LPS O-acetylase OafA/YrhL